MVDPKVVTRVTFNNGQTCPIVGLGTWQSPPDGSVYRAVKAALENGYRHLDCAHVYQNQVEVGQAIQDCIAAGVLKREELFVTSKIWLTFFRKDRVKLCMDRILKDLKLTYCDLILLHWPMSFEQNDDNLFPQDAQGKAIEGNIDFTEAWQGLEPMVDQGLCKSIGISNFNEEQVERVLKIARIKPVVNQVECHPYLAQEKLKQFCNARGILLTAYSPLGNPGSTYFPDEKKKNLLGDPVVVRLAKKYNKNPGQILIRFQVDRGNIVIPKSVTVERIKSNIQVFDFKLTEDELKEMLALDQNYRTCPFTPGQGVLKNYPF